MIPLLAWALTGCSVNCGDGGWCHVDGGKYMAVLPDDADALGRMPVVVMAHGYGGSAQGYVDNEQVTESFSEAGVLLLLPEGRLGGWNVVPNIDQGRDEATFMTNIVDDAAARWRLDEGRVTIAGSSAGAALAWTVACEAPGRFSSVAPISGVFWRPLPDTCSGAPIHLRHVHGEDDNTWPATGGRSFGRNYTQGGVSESFDLWRAHAGCTDDEEVVTDGPLTCRRWLGCDVEVWSCRHDAGHGRRTGWVGRMTAWKAMVEE